MGQGSGWLLPHPVSTGNFPLIISQSFSDSFNLTGDGMYDNVFIATPTHIIKRYCASEFTQAVADFAPGSEFHIASNSRGSAFSYYAQPHVKYHDMNFIASFYYGRKDSIHRRIVDTVNFLRGIFLEGYCEYYLSLEADVKINKHTLPDILSRMQDGVKVLHTDCYPGFQSSQFFTTVNRLTMGCTMIHRSIVEQIPFRYDQSILAAHYDALFAHDCTAAGISMHYDPNIHVSHMHAPNGGRGWEQLNESER